MARSVANVNIATDSFASWLEITNQMATLFSNNAVTANASVNGDVTSGNAVVNGHFVANTLVAVGDLRGGNLTTTGVLTVSTNTTFTGGQINVSSNVYVSDANTYVDSDVLNLVGGNVVATSNLSWTAANVTLTPTIFTVAGTTANVTANVFFRAPVVANSTLTVANTLAAGNTTVTGFINVSSTADLHGAVTVNGAFTVVNTAAVGNTTITGFVNVSSTANVGGAATLRGAVTVNGAFVVGNTAAVGNTTITGFANVSGAADVGGHANLKSTSYFTGNISLSSVADTVVSSNGDIGSNTTEAQLVFWYPKGTYPTAKITATAKSSDSANVEVQELLVAASGSDVTLTVYGTVAAPVTANVGVFSAAINNANVEISFRQAAASSKVSVVAQLIK